MNEIISHHHFMFPFRWDILSAGFEITQVKENESFDRRTDLNNIEDNFGRWSRKKYQIADAAGTIDVQRYNEFTYFHEFTQKAVFDYDYPWKNDQQIVKYFEYHALYCKLFDDLLFYI